MNYANYQQWCIQLLQERIQLRKHQDSLLPKLDAIKITYEKDPLQPLTQVEGFLEAESHNDYQKAQDNSLQLKKANEKAKTAKTQITSIQTQLKKEVNDLQFEYDQLKAQWITFWIVLASVALLILLLWNLL